MLLLLHLMSGGLFWVVLLLAVGLVAVILIARWPRRPTEPAKPGLAEAFWSREVEAEARLRNQDQDLRSGILDVSQVETPELGPLAKLPPFGPVAISLLRLFDRDDVKIHEVARLVESDPSLASELLAVVNSPMFPFQGIITDAGHAITLLGVDRTKSLAAALAMRSIVQGAPRTPVVRRFWTHSIATATIAQEFAPLFGVDPHLAHISALLHDLGRMGLLGAYPAEYSQMALASHETVDEILSREKAGFGMTHCHAGALLAKAWSLPEPLRNVAEHHHDLSSDQKVVSLVQLCCRLADDLMFHSIHCRDLHKPEQTIETYAPAAIREQLVSSMETIETAVITAIRSLDF